MTADISHKKRRYIYDRDWHVIKRNVNQFSLMLCRNVYTTFEGDVYWGVLQAIVSLSEVCVSLGYKCNTLHNAICNFFPLHKI